MRKTVALAGFLLLSSLSAAWAETMPDALNLMLEKADFWVRRDRPDLARETLNAVLTVAPNQPVALARLAEIEADQGHHAEAEALMRRLSALRTASPDVAAEVRAAEAGGHRATLADARRAAQSGDLAGAIAKYKEIFQGPPPTIPLALEYYQTLAGTESGWEEARDGLRQLAEQPGAPAEARISYLRVLSYREATRREVLSQLAAMAKSAPLDDAAKKIRHDTLLWLNAGAADKPAYAQYLADNPDDGAVKARYAALDKPATRADNRGVARARAYAALRAERLDVAEAEFQSALKENAADAEARAGLGLVRLRQNRFAEAAGLLDAATRAAPAQAAQWRDALASAAFWRDMQAATEDRDAGRLASAEDRAQALAAGARAPLDRQAAELLLADVRVRRDELAEAEDAYRAVLKASPSQSAALSGLFNVLLRQRRDREAEALAASPEAEALRLSPAYTVLQAGLAHTRANAAVAAGDTLGARAAFIQARQLAPDDAWLRLDYARFLVAQHDDAAARSIMAVTPGEARVDLLHAAALFQADRQDWTAVRGLLERVPAAAQTEAMTALLDQATLRHDMTLAQMQPPAEARARLLALRPMARTAETRGLLAGALAEVGDAQAALSLLQPDVYGAQMSATPLLQYTALLMKADRGAEAAGLLRQLEQRADLSDTERQGLAGLKSAMAVRIADSARQRGDYADAYDAIAPLFKANSGDPALAQAMGRIYLSAGRPAEALALLDGVLADHPDDLDAQRGAAEAAIAAGETRQARRILAAAVRAHPDDPQVHQALAQLARKEDDSGTALKELKTAQELRLAQLGRGPMQVAAADATDANPFRDAARASDAVPLGDPLLTTLAADTAAVEEQSKPRFVGEVQARLRSGESGLSRLVESWAKAGFSMPLFGMGQVQASLTGVHVDAGDMGSNTDTYRRFGSNMFLTTTQVTKPEAQDANGVAPELSYRLDDVALDVGATPLGFRVVRPVGGLKWTPQLSDVTQLQFDLSRRAVTDSVLSYAGARDPVTGQTWGGVTKTAAQAGLAYDDGSLGVYGDVGYGELRGVHVTANRDVQATLGAYMHLAKTSASDLTLGVNATGMGYDRNLRYFTYGQGGYFSPQEFYALTFPVNYTVQGANFRYSLGGSLGVQHFREEATDLFPDDPTSQAALVALSADRVTDSLFRTRFGGQETTNIGYGLNGTFEYRISPFLTLGGSLSVKRSADWTESTGRITLKTPLGD
ncbi:cellulose biosynthesis protein BcsC [Nitrospirillum sp. BR 11828]|uniref:cellulose biosynthesis protein BcsC n=1 Tax=Nitrospirillum sp. BR 11828 TaxID=3104325 RepID=UPI002ACA9629|nr:cellulose synthase subunit BcsC-related outer membrane protein [Nitrospirillum sp. BR 11828]MDZ5650795.1 cellulose synthase subunit BcsC-related outer membrane protein [Nitrospirillum sp. BR 11828]